MQPNARKIAYSFGTSLLQPAGLTSASLQQWNRSHPFHKSQQQQQQQQLQSDTDSANHPNNFSFRDSISNIDETELEMIIDGAAAASTATSVAGGGGDGDGSSTGTGGAEISSFPLQWTSNPVRDSHVTQDTRRDSVPTEMRVSQASYLRDSQLSYLSYPSIITRESSFVAANRPPYPQHQHHHSSTSPTKQ